MVFYLEHVPTGDRVFLEEGENTIGRDPDCSINMHFLYMSRKHVHILVENDRVFIKDLESRNGTFINFLGIRIDKDYRQIFVDDVLLFGDIVAHHLVHKCPKLGIFTLMEEEHDSEDSVGSSPNRADGSPSSEGTNPESQE
ncbi:uncharacterized protein [Drosophila suzukii]|uniref:FHA domain-containing protein n=1 Tax=Drosophila suzukii TaxID=28584 RepID=A0ABM4TTS9_DROSZ